MTRKFIAIIIAAGLLGAVKGQNLQVKAEKLYAMEAYPAAAKIFEQALTPENRAQVLPKLADCHRRVSNTAEAEKWYAQIPEKEQTTETMYQYGQVLKSNGKYAEAAKAFDRYGELSKDWKESRRLAEECENAEAVKGTGEGWSLKPTNVQEPYSEFGPLLQGNRLYYSAARPKGFFTKMLNLRNNSVFYDIYAADRTQPTQYGKPKLVKGALKSAYHDGPLCFSPDGQTVYFTRSNQQKGKLKRDNTEHAQLQLLEATWNGKKFAEAKPLPLNSDQYSSGHPALSPDGQWLVFASNRPGGQGGTDLWKVQRKGKEWGNPENLGPAVNTPQDEQFPTISPDGSLFFASSGHPGLGGLDIFWAPKTENGWGEPQNLGIPVNSPRDDFSMSWEKNGTGLFTSNRNGGGGEDDLWFFKRAVPMRLTVVDEKTGEPLQDVAVQLSSTSGQETNFVTDAKGQFSLIGDWKRQYKVKLSRDRYQALAQVIATDDAPMAGAMEIKLKMRHVPLIEWAGRVTDAQTGAPVPAATLQLINQNTGTASQQANGDETGHFKTELTEGQGREALVGAPGYFKVRVPFSEPTSREEDITVPTTYTLLPKKVGTVLQIIYYDYRAADLRDRSKEDLDKLLGFLRDNPDAIVELGSHTDARGSLEYNEKLSAERAEAARSYLISKGIPEAQISAKGYGELKPTNNCRDEIPCTEEEHGLNRRTEIVLKEVGK